MLVKGSARRLFIRFERLSIEHKRIARDMVLVMSFALVAKLIGAAKEIAVAWRYGVSDVVDAYLFVFNLVNLPVSIWYSILTVVFIPLAVKLRAEKPVELSRFSAELFGMTTLIAAAVGLLGWASLTGFFQTPLSGLEEEAHTLALRATPWLSILIPLGMITHYGSVLMMSERRHANTLLEGLPSLVLLVAVLLASSGTLAPLLWGTVLGGLLHMVVIVKGALKGRTFKWPHFSMRSPAWRLFWGGMGIMVFGQALQSITGIVDQFFAAHIGPGAIATLGYSNRILSLILTLGATAVARATLPVFSEMGEANHLGLHRISRHWVQIMLILGAFVIAIGWPTASWAARILFERGAFTPDDTQAVAEVLRFGLLQVPFYFGSLLVSQVLFSEGRHRLVAWIAAQNLAVKVVMSFVLVPYFGLPGLVGATALMYIASFTVLFMSLNRVRT